MDPNSIYQQLITTFPTYTIYKNHPLAPYTTLKIGGPADIFIDLSTLDQFISILNFVIQNPSKSPLDKGDLSSLTPCPVKGRDGEGFHILGNGSNVLISDSGLRGIVIRYFDSLQTIIQKTLSQNLIGLENFAYIPASLGGAIVSNIHGIDKTNFNQFLDTITIFNLQTGQTETLKTADLKWDYDYSEFQDKPHLLILSASFNLQKGDGKAALEKYHQIVAEKSLTQPMNSAGCVFKNPPNDSAGRIIDQELHLKGYSIGGTQISPLHANFIVNTGNVHPDRSVGATAKDYLSLIRLIQSTAKSKLNLDLELEIKLLGKF